MFFYLDSELETNKTIKMVATPENKETKGNIYASVEPGHSFSGKTYDEIFLEFEKKGKIEIVSICQQPNRDRFWYAECKNKNFLKF